MTATTHDNYHQAELDRFAALANRWWDAEGPQRSLHVLNPVRLDYVKQRLPARHSKLLQQPHHIHW